MKNTLLVINCFALAFGKCGSPILMRLYFLHGGKRVWLPSCLQSAGWPFILLPLTITYLHRCATIPSSTTKFFSIKHPLFIASAFIGILNGTVNYLYAYGLMRLPVSTATLIMATQVVFTAGFAFVLVKQKFTFYSTNAIVLLLIGAAVLALQSSSDLPYGETSKEYLLGFLMTLGAAALYGCTLPMVELTHKRAKQAITYSLVMEMQMVISMFATIFSTLGMVIHNDLQEIPREAREFELGERKYYMVVLGSAIMWQIFFMGVIGVIFCASSLLSGIVNTALLPMIQILGVIFYHESFEGEKGVALVLSLWGLASYLYNETQKNEKKEKTAEIEISPAEIP